MTSDPAIIPSDGAGHVLPLSLTWDKATVALEAVERALYALADQVTGTVSDVDGSWTLTAHPRATGADLPTLAHRLRQEVTDQTLRIKIAQRTDPVRNLVFALAFSRSGLVERDAGNGATADLSSGTRQTPSASVG